MATFAALEQAIASLPDGVFRVSHSAKRPPTEAELSQLEGALGRPLQPGHRELLARWGVLIVEVSPEVWPRPKAFEVLPAWRFQYGVQVLGVGAALPPELTIESARSAALDALGAVPFMRRTGVPWLTVSTAQGIGTWQVGDVAIESATGDELDRILFELRQLQDGVSELKAQAAGAETLMEQLRAAGWKGPHVGTALEALVKQPPAELRPHLRELAAALLVEDASNAMGCLDVIAVAGRDAFPAVADAVYAHFGRSDDPYVLELLGQVGDVSPRALELYGEGLGSDDDDVLEKAIEAIAAVSSEAVARQLLPAIEARLDGADGDSRFALIALLPRFESPRFTVEVTATLGATDDDFASLLGALAGQAEAVRPLGASLLERYRRMNVNEIAAFNAMTELLSLGLEDRSVMEPVAKAFHARGGKWAGRADTVLQRLARSVR